jgi:hypothetical protein
MTLFIIVFLSCKTACHNLTGDSSRETKITFFGGAGILKPVKISNFGGPLSRENKNFRGLCS